MQFHEKSFPTRQNPWKNATKRAVATLKKKTLNLLVIYEVNFILSDPFHWSYWIFVANFTKIFRSQNLVPACQNAVAETPNVILPEEQTTGIPQWIIVNPVFPPFPRCKISSKTNPEIAKRGVDTLKDSLVTSMIYKYPKFKTDVTSFWEWKFWYKILIPTGQTLQTQATAWVASFEDTNVEFGGETTPLHKLLRAFAAKCSTMARNDGYLWLMAVTSPMVSIKCMKFESTHWRHQM